MPDSASMKFGVAWKALHKAAAADREWFTRANDIMALSNSGDYLAVHAIMIGLKAAYEAGRAGKGLPPLIDKNMQSIAERRLAKSSWREETPSKPPSKAKVAEPEEEPAAPSSKRVLRRPAAAPVVKQDPYLEGIMNRDNRPRRR